MEKGLGQLPHNMKTEPLRLDFHVKKEPRQEASEHENRAFEAQFISPKPSLLGSRC